jgi:serine/threonine-protein kinase
MEFVDSGNLAHKLSGAPLPAREAASLVATLARAMHAAHEAGIVHRDLKPANVLLTSDNTPKISDFGLARRMENETGLTRTGVALGTPSYMAPEQAVGKSSATGFSIDIYALGAILYETLTGDPPFRAETAEETVRWVVSHDPLPPSRTNAKVPRDLETICLKCLQKVPRGRYSTAVALAEDLDRFLRGEAILARSESRLERLARRVRRRPLLSAAVVIGSLLVVALIGSGIWFVSERAAVIRAAQDDVTEIASRLKESSWTEARTAIERAKGRLGDGGPADLQTCLKQGDRDLDLAARLDAIRLNVAGTLGDGPATAIASDKEYEHAFRDAGLAAVHEPPEVVATRVKASNIQNALVAALDDWSVRVADKDRQRWLIEVARLSDPNPTEWHREVRNQLVRRDEETLVQLISTAPPLAEQPASLLLAIDYHLTPDSLERIKFLTSVQQTHLNDFWVNLRLANVLLKARQPAESIPYFQAALAIRPNSALVRNNFGVALSSIGRPAEALAQHEQAVKLDPSISHLHYNLAIALWNSNRNDEVVEHLRKAVALDPRNVETRAALRVALVRAGRGDQAEREWKAILDANPPDHDAWYGYAELCAFLGREDDYRRARQDLLAKFGETTDPRVAERTSRACLLLPASGDELARAATLAERAANVDRAAFSGVYPNFLFAKGLADYRQGRFEPAIAIMRGGAGPALGPAPRLVLAMALKANGKDAEALKTLRAAVESYDWRASQVGDQDSWIRHVLRREAERMIIPNLPDFLENKYEPQENDERLALVGICQSTGRTRALAKLYAAAFAASPDMGDDIRVNRRTMGALAAACAGCGRGLDAGDLDEAEKAKWRETALQWLRADLLSCSNEARKTKTARDRVVKTMTRWEREPDLAGIRESSQIAKLPAGEQKQCLELWRDVSNALDDLSR